MITADLIGDEIRVQELKNIFNCPCFIHNEYFSLYIKSILSMCHGYHYCFVNDTESIDKYSYLKGKGKTDIAEIYKATARKKIGVKRGPSPNRKKILCVELNKEFSCLTEAQQ